MTSGARDGAPGDGVDGRRRRWLAAATLAAGAAGGRALAAPVPAPPPARGPGAPASAPAAPRMPGDPPEHRLVYQLNRIDPEYLGHVLGSIGAMITRYDDNVALAVVVMGPGLHLLARQPHGPAGHPSRAVPAALRERARGQARDYGVRYLACGNTMGTLGWTAADLVDWAPVVDVGAAALMEMQEAGWAYIAW